MSEALLTMNYAFMFTSAELNVIHALVHELRTDSIGLYFKEKNKDTLKSLSKKLNS